MTRIGIWLTHGYTNIYNALKDIRAGDSRREFHLVCSHPHPQFVGAQAADVRLVEPQSCSDAQFLKFVLEVVHTHNIKLIVPSRRQAFFNRYAPMLAEQGVTVATVATTRGLNRIDDKGQLYEYLAGKGIVSIPDFVPVRSLAEFDKAYRALKRAHSTVCVKPTKGVYGSGFRVLKEGPDTMQDLLSESVKLSVKSMRERLRADGSRALMLMQYLEGDERSVDCVAFDGQLVAGVVRRKSAAGAAPQVVEDNPVLLEQVRRLTKRLNLRGLFNVQFKDSGGTPYLLEINTRLSGRAYYATLAGVNLPYLATQLFLGKVQPAEVAVQPQYGLCIGNVSEGIAVPASPPTPTLHERESR